MRAFNRRTLTSSKAAPSLLIGAKKSSNRSSTVNPRRKICLQPWSVCELDTLGLLQQVKVLTPRPMTSMAVPGSFTAGDKAREAISESTQSPKRGSFSKVRRTPKVRVARTFSLVVSVSPPLVLPKLTMWSSGIPSCTNVPGSTSR